MPGADRGSSSSSEMVTSRRDSLGALECRFRLGLRQCAVLFEAIQCCYKDIRQAKLTKCYYPSLSQQGASEMQAGCVKCR